MSEHTLEVVSQYGELSLRLVCHAVPGAPCRLRPEGAAEWSADYDGEMIDSRCWAEEWQEDAGFIDGVRNIGDGVLAEIPVSIEYDECVAVRAVEPHTMLDVPSGGIS